MSSVSAWNVLFTAKRAGGWKGEGEMRCIGLSLGKHRPYKRRVLHATIHVVSRCYICIDALVPADGSS